MGLSSPPALPEPARTRVDIDALYRRLESLRSTMRAPTVAVATWLPAIDGALPDGGLGYGKVHEWIGVQERETDTRRPSASVRRTHWSPALTLLIEMARSAAASSRDGRDRLVWVGQAVWPYPAPLAQAGNPRRGLSLDGCLFVRASRPADRLWATDLALRSRTAAAVIADGFGFDLAATRRLQLAAEASGGLCLLARPPCERCALSAAATRWLVSCVPSPSMNRRWNVELLRCKGMQPAPHAQRAWVLERDHATRALRVAADVFDRSPETEAVAAGIRHAG